MTLFELFSADAELENCMLHLSDYLMLPISQEELSDEGYMPPRIDSRDESKHGFMPRLAA